MLFLSVLFSFSWLSAKRKAKLKELRLKSSNKCITRNTKHDDQKLVDELNCSFKPKFYSTCSQNNKEYVWQIHTFFLAFRSLLRGAGFFLTRTSTSCNGRQCKSVTFIKWETHKIKTEQTKAIPVKEIPCLLDVQFPHNNVTTVYQV